MTMRPTLRKFVLSAHITFAVGWLGAVAAFLALAVAGLTSRDSQMVRAVYLGMDLIAWYVLVPLSFAPWVTGPILSLGTPWGLVRHYWILVKLVITILSTLVLLVHMQPITYLAGAAADGTLSSADHGLQVQMVVAAATALMALLTANVLAVFKPRGMTAYGWRKQYERNTASQP